MSRSGSSKIVPFDGDLDRTGPSTKWDKGSDTLSWNNNNQAPDSKKTTLPASKTAPVQGTGAGGSVQEPPAKGKVTLPLITFLLIAVLGGSFQFGWCIGLFNTPEIVIKTFYVTTYFKRGKIMTESQLTTLWSITNGLFPLGGVIGGLSSGFIGDRLGRKYGIIATNLIVIVSGVLNIVSKFIPAFETIMAARFLSGIASGIFSGVVPMYLNELPPQSFKGAAGTMNQLMVVVGILVANILGLKSVLGTADLWPVLVGFTLVPALVHVGMFFAVESPKYLFINKGDVDGARQVLIKLRGSDPSSLALVEYELQQLQLEKENIARQTNITWFDLVQKSILYRPLIVTCVVQLSQQLSGINAVMFYSTSIFKSVGLTDEWAQYGSILLNVIQVAMTFVCMVIVDRLGRRILLLAGMVGMCIFAYLMSVTSIVSEKNGGLQWLNYVTVVVSVLYIIFFAIGPGAIPWLLTAELFGSDAKGKASSVAVFVNWTASFAVTVSFPFIKDGIGNYSFLIFGSLLVGFSLFMLFFVPETKNKTIEEIQEGFKKGLRVFPARRR